MEHHRVVIRRLTVVLLTTSVALILPSLAGMGASVLLTAGLGVAALALAAARRTLAAAPTVLGYDLGRYAPDLWLGFALATALLVVFADANAGELQTLGGFAGFVAMVNYFLTPLSDFVYRILVRVVAPSKPSER